jgi:hypothetical protein
MDSRPNILLIQADQLNSQGLSMYGNDGTTDPSTTAKQARKKYPLIDTVEPQNIRKQ